MMTNVMVKACLNQEIIKISNLIEVKKLRITHVRDRNLTEGRIYSKAEFVRIPNVPNSECSEVPKCGLNTRHDNREVTLTHLTPGQTLRSDKYRPPDQSTGTGQ